MVGILIVAHGTFGEALIHCASHVLGRRPLAVAQLGVTVHDDPEALIPQAEALVAGLDKGAGVLILSDILGATPANLATRLLKPGRVEGLAGASLPMLIRALTYRDEPLASVIGKAASGGLEGVARLGKEEINAAA
ncbi:MAG: PTS sugar transporter subunit IIA [Burkholderiales bacterium]